MVDDILNSMLLKIKEGKDEKWISSYADIDKMDSLIHLLKKKRTNDIFEYVENKIKDDFSKIEVEPIGESLKEELEKLKHQYDEELERDRDGWKDFEIKDWRNKWDVEDYIKEVDETWCTPDIMLYAYEKMKCC